MPELALHFTVPPEANAASVAAAFQQQLAGLPGVESAEVTADQHRFVGPQEILVVLTTATAMIGASAGAVEMSAKLIAALRQLVDEAGKLGKSLHLGGARLETRMTQVPLDAVTDHDLHAVVADGG